MTELMHAYPAVTWLILAASSCLGFLAVIGAIEYLLFPRKHCKRGQDMQ